MRALKLRVSSESMPVPEGQPAKERSPRMRGMTLIESGRSGMPTTMSLPDSLSPPSDGFDRCCGGDGGEDDFCAA